MEDQKLPHILEKIARLLQRTHRLRSRGERIDQDLRRLDWLNEKAEKLLCEGRAVDQSQGKEDVPRGS